MSAHEDKDKKPRRWLEMATEEVLSCATKLKAALSSSSANTGDAALAALSLAWEMWRDLRNREEAARDRQMMLAGGHPLGPQLIGPGLMGAGRPRKPPRVPQEPITLHDGETIDIDFVQAFLRSGLTPEDLIELGKSMKKKADPDAGGG